VEVANDLRPPDPGNTHVAGEQQPMPNDESDEEEFQSSLQSGPPDSGGYFGSIGRAFTGLSHAILGVAPEDFEAWFGARYGLPAPTFSKLCFGETVKSALDEGRLLLLWFHQDESTATEKLCKEILQNISVLRVIRRSYTLWAGDTCRFEPGQIAKLLTVTVFPTLVICQPLQHGFDHTFCLEWPLGTFAQPLFRLSPEEQGQSLNTDQAIAVLTSAADDHRNEIQNRESQAARRSSQLAEERRLREEQDREFEESLLADQLAAVRRSEATSSDPTSRTSKPEAASVEISASVPSDGDLPRDSASCLPESVDSKSSPTEFDLSQREREEELKVAEEKRLERGAEIQAQPEPRANGLATAKLSLRLPTGSRLQRIFQADQTLADVYEWAHCCRPAAQPLNFELCTSFPAKSLDDRTATVGDSGLAPSAVLVMKSADD